MKEEKDIVAIIQDRDKEITKLKREIKKLNKDMLATVKEKSDAAFVANINLKYTMDEYRDITIGVSQEFKDITIEEAHELLYMRLLSSLDNIVTITTVDEKAGE